MKVFILFAHPEPQSFNGAMFRHAVSTLSEAGHEVRQSDLYSMQFNPVSDRSNFSSVLNPTYFKQQLEELYATEVNGFSFLIQAELQKLEWCDVMIWQFPLWWFSVPAILKGWVDRVFAMGKVFGQGKLYDNGLMRGKRAMLSLTTGSAEETFLKNGFHGDISGILRPVHRGMLEFAGFEVLAPQVVYAPVRKTPEELNLELEKWATRLQNLPEEMPNLVGHY